MSQQSRLTVVSISSEDELLATCVDLVNEISPRSAIPGYARFTPLVNCCALLSSRLPLSLVIQRRVLDRDFLAEFNSYYSRQFGPVERDVCRIHFFQGIEGSQGTPLSFMDQDRIRERYLGFITLRPVPASPVAASILCTSLADQFVICDDRFHVHIAGIALAVRGTPFMQQDNAVGSCAQASIWMALRTLRRREGDRAFDPAQITDAATRYIASSRLKPNRTGLSIPQVFEAIRAAGYSPEVVRLTKPNPGGPPPTDGELALAMQSIHPYIESGIPLILGLSNGLEDGHAVVAIGHGWSETPTDHALIQLDLPNGIFEIRHASNWVPSVIINNDNTGPYRHLSNRSSDDYAFESAAFAVPLLPADVFMNAEEALAVATLQLHLIFDKGWPEDDLSAHQRRLTVRLLLVEKHRLRQWATEFARDNLVGQFVREMDMPRRVWVCELHKADHYGLHSTQDLKTMVGFVLVDPTGDPDLNSVLAFFLNVPELATLPFGYFAQRDAKNGTYFPPIAVGAVGALLPIRGVPLEPTKIL